MEEEIKKLKKYAAISVGAGFVIFVILLLFFIFKTTKLSIAQPIDPAIFGQFGDIFGGVIGSVWALSGIILFYVALRIQTEEFRLQRKELEETRKVFQEQSALAKIDQFENKLFNLLQLLEIIINNSVIHLKKVDDETISEVSGRNIFEELCLVIADEYYNEYGETKYGLRKSRQIFKNTYSKNYFEHSSFLDHYFQQVIQIFNLIHHSKNSFGEEKQNDYISLVCSYLSKYELIIISYHVVYKPDTKLSEFVQENQINQNAFKDKNSMEDEYIPDTIHFKFMKKQFEYLK